jgi:hypothetical protein
VSKSIIVLLILIIGIGLVSGLLGYWRAQSFSTPDELATKGLAMIRRERLIFYGLFIPVLVGIISYFVYRWMTARWSGTGESAFLLLAVAMALVFTALAAVVFRMRGFAEFTALHLLYTVGFGWIMPRFLGG